MLVWGLIPLVVVGAGGHAKVVLEILEHMGGFEIAACTSLHASEAGLFGYRVLGEESLAGLLESGVRHAFPAIGDNAARMRQIESLRSMGFTLVNALSPRATLARRTTLGEGIAVMAGAVINPGAAVADGAIINTGATVDHDCRIGACAHIAPGAHLSGNVRVGEGAFLGVGCSAIQGVSIGDWTMVGAGAAVIRDLPERVTAVGVPAVIRLKADR